MRPAVHALAVSEGTRGDWHRNIVSLRQSIDLFGDLVDDPAHQQVLLDHEMATKPTQRTQPIISRPFEDACIYDPIAVAIRWPFERPAVSRYSAGSYGVWYGAYTLEATIHETVHHFRRNTLASEIARNSAEPIEQQRRVHLVHCSAALVDLRECCAVDERLLDPNDYSHCQAVGAQLHAEFLPGVLTYSARLRGAEVAAVFIEKALSNPRPLCFLTYQLDARTGDVTVQRQPGAVEWVLRGTGAGE